MITFKNVSKIYSKEFPALRDINFSIDQGEFVFLTGPSGSGKTTISRLLLREIIPTAGEIHVGKYNYQKIKKREIPHLRRQIGMVFQDFQLLPDRTIYENIFLIMEIIGKKKHEAKEKVLHLLDLVGLESKAKLYPQQLSGGEVQRSVIARALASEPVVIFADEPTGNLDAQTAWNITQLLQTINKSGTTIVMSTHNLDIVKATNHRLITIKDGQLVGDTKDVGNPRPETENLET